jgi:hypothetical protein
VNSIRADSSFKQLAESWKKSQEKIITQQGCIVFDETFAVVIERISSGYYDAHLDWKPGRTPSKQSIAGLS